MTKKELDYSRNEDILKLLISQLRRYEERISLGGGPKRIEKLHKKGKLTARERIEKLIDADQPFHANGHDNVEQECRKG